MRDEINDAISRRKRRRKLDRGPYIPGAYDLLLAPREWQPSASVLAFVIEAEQYQDQDGLPDPAELTIIEHTRSGAHPAHHICDSREPITLELQLADGRRAEIDIRFLAADPVLTECAHTEFDMFLDLREAADLLRFSGIEDPDLEEK